MNVEESNKLIAQFMGVTPQTPNSKWYDGYLLQNAGLPFAYGAHGNGTKELKFHTSWDWLMPAVDNIKSKGYEFNILTNAIEIGESDAIKERQFYIHGCKYDKNMNSLTSTYNGVVRFIKWYKENNPE